MLLLMPDISYISDENENCIRRWIASGGALYASGKTSLFDEEFQEKLDYGLADVYGRHYIDEKVEMGALGIRRYKKGRVCFNSNVPEKALFLDSDGRPFENLDNVGYKDMIKFRLPSGHIQIVSIIKNLSPKGLPFEVIAPNSIATDAYYTDEALVIHLVNFEWRLPKKNILIKINPNFLNPKSANLFSPDKVSYEAETLKIEKRGNFFEIIVPETEVYSVVEVNRI